mmetsp:Transcript_25467/g.81464  ORF Transcript_25467/g.81464 Transcript_25467/m.81464 type:complete len:623 (+) Transcript_25467:165-2033(+)
MRSESCDVLVGEDELVRMCVRMLVIVVVALPRRDRPLPGVGKGVGQRVPPLVAAARHLLIGEQALVQLRLCSRVVELLPDAHHLRLAVAVRLVPERPDVFLQALGPLLARQRRPPGRARRQLELRACERQARLLLVPRRQPRNPLEPQQPRQRAGARPHAQRRVEARRVEGPPRAEDEGRDAVLDRLGRVLVLSRLDQPLRVLLGLLHAEARRAEQRGRRELAVLRAHQLGRRVDLAQEGLDRAELRLAHEVALVDEEEIGELELVTEQVRDGALVALGGLPSAVDQRVHRVELLEDGRGVDDRDEVVQARDIAQAHAARLVREGEGLGDGERLRDARRLDKDVVEAALGRERGERGEQVLAQRAADAAVRELDHLLLLLENASLPHQLGVDVDRGHIVDHHRDAVALAVVEHVVEQRRLAGSEEAGQDRHGQRAALSASLARQARLEHRRVWVDREGEVAPEEDDCRGPCGRLEVRRVDVDAAHAVGRAHDELPPLAVLCRAFAGDPPDNVVEGLASRHRQAVQLRAHAHLPVGPASSRDGNDSVTPNQGEVGISADGAVALEPRSQKVAQDDEVASVRARRLGCEGDERLGGDAHHYSTSAVAMCTQRLQNEAASCIAAC